MNILMISDVYFPRINGVSTSIETFREEMVSRGHRVFLIAPSYGGNDRNDQDTARIASRMILFDPEDRMMKYGSITAMLPFLQQQEFDLVHIQTPFVAHYAGATIARRLEIPLVVTYHTFFEEYLYHYVPFLPSGLMRSFARRFSRTQCNAVNAIVVPSIAMQDKLLSYGVSRPIHLIPTGIPLAQFTPANGQEFRAKHGIGNQQPTLLYVGRVAFEKNLEFLLRATDLARREIPNLLLVIAGEGPAEKSLKKLAAELQIERHIKFVGYLRRDSELLDCYSAADAFVFASKTETQGLVLLEAMALGLPVVSTAEMGTRDVLQPGCGAIIAPDELKGFAKEMIRIATDTELRARLGKRARNYALQWDSGELAEKMLSLYATLSTRR